MSNTERKQEEVKTESGHVLIVKSFVTIGEKNEISEIYFTAAEAIKAGTPQVGENRASYRADRKAVELVIISLDGETETQKIVESIINGMPSSEGEEVLAVVKGILEPKKKAPTSSQDTSGAGS